MLRPALSKEVQKRFIPGGIYDKVWYEKIIAQIFPTIRAAFGDPSMLVKSMSEVCKHFWERTWCSGAEADA